MSAAVASAIHQSVPDIHQVASGILHRKCACGQHTGGAKCPACKGKGVEADAKAASCGTRDLGPGRPIEGQSRRFMESRFGRDFSAVRVHTDPAAQSSAASVNARAYTSGSDIVFGRGEYALQSFEGRHLLAHELTHVLQQRGHLGRQPKAMLSTPGDPAEREADAVADAVMSGTRSIPSSFIASPAPVQRACGEVDIGTPAGCNAEPPTFVAGQKLVKFNFDCDTFAPTEEAGLVAFAGTIAATGPVTIHGYASTDGDATYNQNLSCARALKAKTVLESNGVAPGRITVERHGPTPGPVDERRSTTIEAPIAPAPPPPPPPPAPPVTMTIAGSSELWWFDGETPAGYPVNQALTASAGSLNGTFTWSLVTASPPALLLPVTVVGASGTAILGSLDASAAVNDITVRVDFVGTAGGVGSATRDFTALAPDSLNHLRDVDRANAALGYESEIHYSILDQFGTVLPRFVPLNEEFTAPATAVFPFSNWTRPPACGASGVCTGPFNPADWFDQVTGESDPGAFPSPIGPGLLLSNIPVEQWPGNWRIGSPAIGRGRLVRTVTWQRRIGSARHI